VHTSDYQIHLALQYLAAAGSNFLQHEEDDSHTNVAWDKESASFVSRTFPNGDYLRLELMEFRLHWHGENEYSIALERRSHGEVLVWLHHMAVKMGYSDYEFDIAYHLGQGWASPLRMFEALDPDKVERQIALRNQAEESLSKLKTAHNLSGDIRVWPHHFDTGLYVKEENSAVGIGLGMAVPDQVLEDYYLYVAAYNKTGALSTEGFKKLTQGVWKNDSFKA